MELENLSWGKSIVALERKLAEWKRNQQILVGSSRGQLQQDINRIIGDSIQYG